MYATTTAITIDNWNLYAKNDGIEKEGGDVVRWLNRIVYSYIHLQHNSASSALANTSTSISMSMSTWVLNKAHTNTNTNIPNIKCYISLIIISSTAKNLKHNRNFDQKRMMHILHLKKHHRNAWNRKSKFNRKLKAKQGKSIIQYICVAIDVRYIANSFVYFFPSLRRYMNVFTSRESL